MRCQASNHRKLLQAGWLLCLLIGAGGCGPRRPAMAPVSGQVTLDGQPVAGAAVVFLPHSGGRPASGATDAAGVYHISTYEPGDGAPPGSYAVSIAKTAVTTATADKYGLSGAPEPSSAPARPLLPLRYAAPPTSGFVCEIKAGQNRFDLPLKSDE